MRLASLLLFTVVVLVVAPYSRWSAEGSGEKTKKSRRTPKKVVPSIEATGPRTNTAGTTAGVDQTSNQAGKVPVYLLWDGAPENSPGIEVEASVIALCSQTIHDMMSDLHGWDGTKFSGTNRAVIPISSVDQKTLDTVIRVCGEIAKMKPEDIAKYNKYAQAPTETTGLTQQADIVIPSEIAQMLPTDISSLMPLYLAANYLAIPLMMVMVAKSIGNAMKTLNLQELRTTFGIPADGGFTPQEEKLNTFGNPWAGQGW